MGRPAALREAMSLMLDPKKLLGELTAGLAQPGSVRGILITLGLVVVAIGLGILNRRLGLEDFVDVPATPIRRAWLPLLFLLLCLNVGLGLRLYRLIAKPAATEHGDIDLAWLEARVGLRRAAIDLDSLPVFLVLGDPAGGGRSLFEASRLAFPVLDVPRRADAPVRVSATRDAIYVSCPGASALARLATTLNERGRATDARGSPSPLIPDAAAAADGAPAEDPAAHGVGHPVPSRAEAARSTPPGRAVEVALQTRRLQHLCALIARDREPFCPVNGMLLLVPLAATEDDDLARQAGLLGHFDFNTASEAFGIRCPVLALLCDLERMHQVERLLRAFTTSQRLPALGRTFPLAPELDTLGRTQLVERGVAWIGQSLLAPTILRLFALDASGHSDQLDLIEENGRLVRFWLNGRDTWRRLGRILGRFISLDTRGGAMIGGCFLGCTGHDPAREQAFVQGVLHLLGDQQDFVCWTPTALEADRSRTRLAQVLDAASVGLAAVAVVAAWLLWPR